VRTEVTTREPEKIAELRNSQKELVGVEDVGGREGARCSSGGYEDSAACPSSRISLALSASALPCLRPLVSFTCVRLFGLPYEKDMPILARWLSILLRNLGVGIKQRCSHSRACVGAGVGVKQGCSSNPAAASCLLVQSPATQCGKHSSSPAEINWCASMLALWLWRSSHYIGLWPVHYKYDGHWLAIVERGLKKKRVW
jgi:hypothetical protein